MDHDGLGDACDSDIDGDGILNQNDACPTTWGISKYNGCPDIYPPVTTIFSPNKPYYNSTSLFVSVSLDELANWIKESVDYSTPNLICNNCNNYSSLKTLPEGLHTLTISTSDIFNNIGSAETQFTIDTIKPLINDVKTNDQKDIIGDQVVVGNSLNFKLNYSEINTKDINGLCAYNVSNPSTYQSITDNNTSSGSSNLWSWTFNLSGLSDNSTIPYCQICVEDKANNIGCWSHIGNYIIDKCLPNIFQINNSCSITDTFVSWYNDINNCYAQTGTDSDKVDIQNKSYPCDFCIPNWTTTINTCNPDDSLSTEHNDSNSCFAKTGLNSDLEGKPENKTNPLSCDFNKDGFIGDITNVNSSINLSLENSNETISFKEENRILFEFNPSNVTINFANLFIEEQLINNSFAYLIINGLDLTSQNKTKTVYINKILNGTGVCIKDSEITSISEVSASCTGSNEFWLRCPGINGVYSCNLTENNTIYKISGLKHSGVKEQFTFCGDNVYNGAESCSSCSSDCGVCPNTGGGGGGSIKKPINSNESSTGLSNQTPANIGNLKSPEESSSGSSPITGAVIGTGNKVSITFIVVFVLALIAGTFLVYNKRKNKTKMKKKKRLKAPN